MVIGDAKELLIPSRYEFILKPHLKILIVSTLQHPTLSQFDITMDSEMLKASFPAIRPYCMTLTNVNSVLQNEEIDAGKNPSQPQMTCNVTKNLLLWHNSEDGTRSRQKKINKESCVSTGFNDDDDTKEDDLINNLIDFSPC